MGIRAQSNRWNLRYARCNIEISWHHWRKLFDIGKSFCYHQKFKFDFGRANDVVDGPGVSWIFRPQKLHQ